eukprot:TRINITY_DN11382_c2_g1_i1.p1 TRINITY_DN11382_c2_g1~~TRINITY_DN11382_c2_g1_i1.p1  ORF type:complete len:343 (-),score=43.99 TRINITY_DN11382_c2_g1_i1:102-1130(-)
MANDWWTSEESFEVANFLEATHDAQAAIERFDKTCAECLKALKKMCSDVFSAPEFRVAPFDWTPDVCLEPFGSTRQGTALASSDLDVRMTFEQFAVHGQDRQLKYLRAIEAAPGRFEVIKMVLARLPVLRLRFDGWLEVDLTMGGSAEEGPWIDTCVRSLLTASVDGNAERFVRLVKAFAKEHKLVDAYGGFLNSTSWTCVAISFLQEQGCLPALKNVDRCEKAALWPVRLTASLFIRFFAFVERLGRRPHRLSLVFGDTERARHRSWSGNMAHPLTVQHPDREGVNLAGCLSEGGWKKSVEKCRWARQRLLPSPTQTDVDLKQVVKEIFGSGSTTFSQATA